MLCFRTQRVKATWGLAVSGMAAVSAEFAQAVQGGPTVRRWGPVPRGGLFGSGSFRALGQRRLSRQIADQHAGEFCRECAGLQFCCSR